ncbi:V-set and immunoglobulin domain-containing protein 10-like [Eublepharis macularius]|uniref:V-set and immunoglobulin domain-containing protein 10-like n=1 Tax=Eublepharis macularius TaxID=481883 RepID=UPI0024100BCB|nr:V-set and immunoglobulin domain-containing protein 10-like [Eublepharis macularius]
MAHSWHWGTCLLATLTVWQLALLVPFIPALPSPLLARLAGDNTSLTIPFSLPAPEILTIITWRKNMITLAAGALRPNFTVFIAPNYQLRFHVDPTSGSLNITALNTSDSGVYTVEVSALDNTVLKANVTLKVYEEVHNITVAPSSAEVTEGDSSVALTCSPIQGSVTWTKDGRTLGENPRFLRSGGSLKISLPQRNDAGIYRCTVSNPFGNGTGSAQLTVYYGPETPNITISSSDQDPDMKGFVLVNASVNLTCLAPSQPPAEIYWNVADTQDHLVPSLPSLLLPRVQLNQAGTYSCLAINQHTRRRVRNNFSLVVAQRPTGFPQCSVSSANTGSALLFSCSWPGGSPDPQLSFQGLPGDTKVDSSYLQQLMVSPFPAGLSGRQVTCLAHHLTGQRNCSIIPEAPSGVFLSFQAFDNMGGTVAMEMDCQGTFNPAEINWFQSGQPLVSTGGHYHISPDGTRLTIWNFTAPRDLGNYSANCSNPLGSQHVNLNLVGPAISNWTLSRGLDPHSAYIAWAIPNGSVVTGFWIQMEVPKQGRSASEWKTVQVLGATNRSATVVGLQPESTYSFQVVPRLGLQAGNASQAQTLWPEPHLNSGAIAGIVIGSILGMLLILALLILLIFFLRRARNKKVPDTPPEKRQHYLSRQFPNGKEQNEPSWGNPRWSSGDSDIYAITYEEHLRRYGGPASLSFSTRDSRHRSFTPSLPQPGAKNVRSATQV